MAKGIYEELKQIMEVIVDNRAVAVTAHEAIMEMRPKWMRFLLLWAPFVHFGA